MVGWLLKFDMYGGLFLYYMDNNQVVVGFVVGLGYMNLYLLLFEEFQCYKMYLLICVFFEGGKCVLYGVCVIMVGGLLLLLKMVFLGGVLIGDDVGFLNVLWIKGSYVVIKIGMLVVDVVFDVV